MKDKEELKTIEEVAREYPSDTKVKVGGCSDGLLWRWGVAFGMGVVVGLGCFISFKQSDYENDAVLIAVVTAIITITLKIMLSSAVDSS